ncbi:hypothetical protein ACHAXT_003265 [Thalassiosira profunda]
MPPGGSDDDDGASEFATTKIIDLQTHTRRQSPAETLASLSTACDRLGVDAFDVYDHSYLRRFEAEVARHFGKEDGVFCLSGGMAQSIALLIHARNRTRVANEDDGDERVAAFACHPTSHLLLHENDAYSELLGMEAVVVDPGSSKERSAAYNPEALKEKGCYGMGPMRLSHVQHLFSSRESHSANDISSHPNHSADISTLLLELPHREIGGKLTPWEEVEAMARLCDERGVKFHCDGARLFEASAGYGHKSVAQTAQPFASVYVSFYKGLGAISGAMLLGDAAYCAQVREWLRVLGGNLYSVLPYAVSSWDGFQRNCIAGAEELSVFEDRKQKLVRVLEQLNADSAISEIVQFDPAVPETNMVHGYLRLSYDECMSALESVERDTGVRVLSRVRSCTDEMFGCRFEWTIGASNVLIDDDSSWRAGRPLQTRQ